MKIANGKQLFPGPINLISLNLAHRTAGFKSSACFLGALWGSGHEIWGLKLLYLFSRQSYRTRVIDKKLEGTSTMSTAGIRRRRGNKYLPNGQLIYSSQVASINQHSEIEIIGAKTHMKCKKLECLCCCMVILSYDRPMINYYCVKTGFSTQK